MRINGPQLSCWLLALGLLLLVQATLPAQPMSVPPEPQPLPLQTESLQQQGQTQTDPWQSFDSAWSSLKLELMGWSEDSQTLYNSLEALQTEAEELRSSLTLSREQYKASEEARMIERKAAEARVVDAILRGIEAQKQMEAWRTGAKVAIAVGAAGWILATVALIR